MVRAARRKARTLNGFSRSTCKKSARRSRASAISRLVSMGAALPSMRQARAVDAMEVLDALVRWRVPSAGARCQGADRRLETSAAERLTYRAPGRAGIAQEIRETHEMSEIAA